MGLETKIQADIIRALIRDDRVAWCSRNNTGKAMVNGRIISIGLGKGGADIVGQLKSGHFLAIEVKTQNGRVSNDQKLWLNRVKIHRGCSGVARSVSDAKDIIDEFTKAYDQR